MNYKSRLTLICCLVVVSGCDKKLAFEQLKTRSTIISQFLKLLREIGCP